MSASRYVVIRCDHDGCMRIHRGSTDAPAGEARKEAAALGWYSRIVRSGARVDYYRIDACPEHAPK